MFLLGENDNEVRKLLEISKASLNDKKTCYLLTEMRKVFSLLFIALYSLGFLLQNKIVNERIYVFWGSFVFFLSPSPCESYSWENNVLGKSLTTLTCDLCTSFFDVTTFQFDKRTSKKLNKKFQHLIWQSQVLSKEQ